MAGAHAAKFSFADRPAAIDKLTTENASNGEVDHEQS
jgi:hypothetical protein